MCASACAFASDYHFLLPVSFLSLCRFVSFSSENIHVCETCRVFPLLFSSLLQNVAPTLKAQGLLEEGNWDVIHHQLALSLLFV